MRLVTWAGRFAALGVVAACAVPLVAGAAPIQQTTLAAEPVAAAGQSSEIYLVELDGSADTFRKEAKAVGLKYTERFAYKRLFKGVAVRINSGDAASSPESAASRARIRPVSTPSGLSRRPTPISRPRSR